MLKNSGTHPLVHNQGYKAIIFINLFIYVDGHCNNLTTPSNGEITSCSSGSIGVGYEGDTCSFTCNTGYELTGSDTRTCQSDRSWSGTKTMCKNRIGKHVQYY